MLRPAARDPRIAADAARTPKVRTVQAARSLRREIGATWSPLAPLLPPAADAAPGSGDAAAFSARLEVAACAAPPLVADAAPGSASLRGGGWRYSLHRCYGRDSGAHPARWRSPFRHARRPGATPIPIVRLSLAAAPCSARPARLIESGGGCRSAILRRSRRTGIGPRMRRDEVRCVPLARPRSDAGVLSCRAAIVSPGRRRG